MSAFADLARGMEAVAKADNDINDAVSTSGPNLTGNLVAVANGYTVVSQAVDVLTADLSSGADPSVLNTDMENIAGAEDQLAGALSGISVAPAGDGSGDSSGDSSGVSTKEALEQNVVELDGLTQSISNLDQVIAGSTDDSITPFASAAQDEGVTNAINDMVQSRVDLGATFTDIIENMGDDGTLASIVRGLNDSAQTDSDLSQTISEKASQ